MSDATRAGTVVLGAGIVGVCCARYLQHRGEAVTLIDRDGFGEGCSFGNAGVLSSWSMEGNARPGLWRSLPGWLLEPLGPVSLKPAYLPRLLPWLLKFAAATHPRRRAEIAEALFALNNPTVEMFRELLTGSGHEGLVVDSSYLFVTRNPRRLDIAAPEWRRRIEHGAPVTELGAGELHELEPDLAPAYVKAIRVGGQGRVLNPGRLVKVLGEAVLADGGRFVQSAVQAVTPRAGGGALLHTGDGPLEAERLVVAAGAWSAQLASAFDLRLPLEAERGYHMEFKDPGVRLTDSVQDIDRTFIASSMEGGLRCAGTSEFNGLAAPPDWRRARIMKTLGQALLPGLNVEQGSEWMGHRPALPDTIPVIGAVPGHTGVYLACGHGHLGLTGAPMTGRIIAGLLSGERTNTDLSAYAVERFG